MLEPVATPLLRPHTPVLRPSMDPLDDLPDLSLPELRYQSSANQIHIHFIQRASAEHPPTLASANNILAVCVLDTI